MEGNEHKLLKAGFRFLRTRDNYPGSSTKPRYDIVYWDNSVRHWSILERDFPTKKAREERMKELLEDEKSLTW